MLLQSLQSLHGRFIRNKRRPENKLLLGMLKKNADYDSKILDIGCGVGENLSLLRSAGYKNIVGVDISEEMLNIASKNGHNVSLPEALLVDKNLFDVLLFSHVLEHIEFKDLQNFLESYFKLCKSDGRILICMPLLYDGFFNDVDHYKTYYPKGLCSLFSSSQISRQYRSEFTLKLVDLRYLRASLVPYHIRSRHIRSVLNYINLVLITFFFFIIRMLSFGLLSKVTSYVAIFSLEKPNINNDSTN
jgi:ubiquinone/menaquinone biosynthesis C-methylase UbiE